MPIRRLKLLTGLALLFLLSGCGTNSYGAKLPYDAWRLGFFAPNYMEVWIETANVIDINDRIFRRAMGGIASVRSPKNFRGNPKGWPKQPGDGKGKHVFGADLPRLIYVRWQSLGEPQTYEAFIEIPDSMGHEMLQKSRTHCFDDLWIDDYRKNVVIGLAPGGIAKTWIMGVCLDAIEVSRVQAKVAKKGPYEGHSNGLYYSGQDPESKAYIEKFGIPFDSW